MGIMLFTVDASQSEALRYKAMLRQVGFGGVGLWAWFKEGYSPAPDISYDNVRLVFHARDGGLLNDDYIRSSSALPRNEIHRCAPSSL
jgi:hypothetical protein